MKRINMESIAGRKSFWTKLEGTKRPGHQYVYNTGQKHISLFDGRKPAPVYSLSFKTVKQAEKEFNLLKDLVGKSPIPVGEYKKILKSQISKSNKVKREKRKGNTAGKLKSRYL